MNASKPRLRLTPIVSATLLALNIVGAILYDWRTSLAWVTPADRELNSNGAAPFVWFAAALPIVVVFFLLNVSWGTLLIWRRDWRSGRSWLMLLPVWLVAIAIDFYHH